MAEKQKELQQVMKEPQQVTTKNPNRVKAGKRLAKYNHRKREEKKAQTVEQGAASKLNQYYGIKAVLAVGVIGGLGYYIYRTKKGQATTRRGASTSGEVPNNPPKPLPLRTMEWGASTIRAQPPGRAQSPGPQFNKFETD